MKGRRTSWTRARLEVEMLEQREMLDGNVSVFVNGAGDLVIAGDNAANSVRVDQFGPAGSPFTVRGLSPLGGGPTAINGVPNGTVVLSGVQNLKVHLGGGNDFFSIAIESPTVVVPG